MKNIRVPRCGAPFSSVGRARASRPGSLCCMSLSLSLSPTVSCHIFSCPFKKAIKRPKKKKKVPCSFSFLDFDQTSPHQLTKTSISPLLPGNQSIYRFVCFVFFANNPIHIVSGQVKLVFSPRVFCSSSRTHRTLHLLHKVLITNILN